MNPFKVKPIGNQTVIGVTLRNKKGETEFVACSKGWSERCRDARSKQCSCKCGGLFHGARKNERHQRKIGQTNIFNFLS